MTWRNPSGTWIGRTGQGQELIIRWRIKDERLIFTDLHIVADDEKPVTGSTLRDFRLAQIRAEITDEQWEPKWLG